MTTPMERDMLLRDHPADEPASAAVGESYYIRTHDVWHAVTVALLEHAKRHGYVGQVLHAEKVTPILYEVVVATSERVEEGS